MPPNQPVEHSVYYIPTGDLHLKVRGLVAFYVWLSDDFWMSLYKGGQCEVPSALFFLYPRFRKISPTYHQLSWPRPASSWIC